MSDIDLDTAVQLFGDELADDLADELGDGAAQLVASSVSGGAATP